MKNRTPPPARRTISNAPPVFFLDLAEEQASGQHLPTAAFQFDIRESAKRTRRTYVDYRAFPSGYREFRRKPERIFELGGHHRIQCGPDYSSVVYTAGFDAGEIRLVIDVCYIFIATIRRSQKAYWHEAFQPTFAHP